MKRSIWARIFSPTRTKKLEEFLQFVREKKVEYITIFPKFTLIPHSSEAGSFYHSAELTAVSPWGERFTCTIRTRGASTDTGDATVVQRQQKSRVHGWCRRLAAELASKLPAVRVSTPVARLAA